MHHQPAGLLALAICTLLSGCGGGELASTPPAPTQGFRTTELAGTWVQNQCSALAQTSSRRFWRIEALDERTVRLQEGWLTYTDTACRQGEATFGPDNVGAVTFDRLETTPTGWVARWGGLTIKSGTAYLVWSYQGARGLCPLGDSLPTLYPLATDVDRSLAALPAAECYLPLAQLASATQ